jgi:hypothetical protein
MKSLKCFTKLLFLLLGAWCFNVCEALADSSGRCYAVTQNPVTGRMRGKFANAVFATQFHLNTMRSKALVIRNPKTLLQRTQRSKITVTMECFRLFVAICRVGFRLVANGMSPFNYGFKLAIKNNITGSYPNFIFNPVDLQLSDGNLTPSTDENFFQQTVNFIFGWIDNSGSGDALATDLAYLIMFNENTKEVMYDNSKTRSGSPKSIAIPATWLVGHKVYGYIFFASADGQRISASEYIACVTIQA